MGEMTNEEKIRVLELAAGRAKGWDAAATIVSIYRVFVAALGERTGGANVAKAAPKPKRPAKKPVEKRATKKK